MPINVSDIKNHNVKQDELFLFDTNVLLRIFYQYGRYGISEVQNYTRLFTDIIKSKAKIMLPSCILSEFTSVFIRLEYKRLVPYPPSNQYFKEIFRNSNDYDTIMEEIRTIVNNQLLPFSIKYDDNFAHIDLINIFSNLKNMDFNDAYCLSLSKINNCYLVTDDRDLSKGDVITGKVLTILTANYRMIK